MRTGSSEKSGTQRDALDSRLGGYSAGAKVAAAARRLRSRTGNWPFYAAAAGSALAMTTSASASIISGVYTGAGPNGGASVRVQSNGQSIKGLPFGLGEINIKANPGTNVFGQYAKFSAEGILPLQIFEAGSYGQYAKNFALGAQISSAAGVLAANGARIAKAIYSGGSSFGSFNAGVPGYVGFAVDQGAGNVNYGWLKLEFSFDAQTHVGILEALGYGYETTAGKAIGAGDTGPTPTPEPGTMALSILAAGAAGVVALRRLRQAD
jgi:hypothetical protein